MDRERFQQLVAKAVEALPDEFVTRRRIHSHGYQRHGMALWQNLYRIIDTIGTLWDGLALYMLYDKLRSSVNFFGSAPASQC
jgi:hypothetical protein